MKWLRVKSTQNKKNGQINISLPRRKISKDKIKEILKKKEFKIKLKV